jgi:hypothetical protein
VSRPPSSPQIFHIVHYDKLPSIIEAGGLLCDSRIQQQPVAGTTIGMGDLKRDRLALPVGCHPGTCVGDYVPFYFCPRSLMLYVISRANHEKLAYRGGQRPIVHLEARFKDAVDWAEENRCDWAFTASNAAARYTRFYNNRDDLDQINWDAVRNNSWSDPAVREGKQAEFLMHGFFPWELVTRIAVYSQGVYGDVMSILASAAHKPRVEIKQDWYY